MENRAYTSAVKSLGASIFLTELAIAGAALLLVFTLDDSIRILTIIGLWDKEFGAKLWIVWPIVSLTILAIAWAEFIFIPRARKLLSHNLLPEKFGDSGADELSALNEVRSVLNKYAIFLIAEVIAIGLFIGVGFLNVILTIFLIGSLVGLLMFLRENAKILKAEGALLR